MFDSEFFRRLRQQQEEWQRIFDKLGVARAIEQWQGLVQNTEFRKTLGTRHVLGMTCLSDHGPRPVAVGCKKKRATQRGSPLSSWIVWSG